MNIIVDASVIVAVITNEPEKQQLITLTEGAELVAPNSVHWEIGNAFSAMLKRKRISIEQTRRALRAYNEIPIKFIDVDLTEALEISDRLSVYAYDAYLLWCAAKHNYPLLTLDQALMSRAKQIHVRVLEVTE